MLNVAYVLKFLSQYILNAVLEHIPNASTCSSNGEDGIIRDGCYICAGHCYPLCVDGTELNHTNAAKT